MQSRRLYLPAIQFTTFERVIEISGVALAEPGGKDVLDTKTTTLLVGPEGGFDSEELDYAVPKIELSRNILRVETAAIMAGAALVACHSLRQSAFSPTLSVVFPDALWHHTPVGRRDGRLPSR